METGFEGDEGGSFEARQLPQWKRAADSALMTRDDLMTMIPSQEEMLDSK